ncbi:MAG: hypothetical protein ACLQU5_04660, partial [Isosphaeraceae bacterium]
RVASGEWRVASGEWRVASGEWRVASGEWRVASGEWRVASGEKIKDRHGHRSARVLSPLATQTVSCGKLFSSWTAA